MRSFLGKHTHLALHVNVDDTIELCLKQAEVLSNS